MKTKSIPLFLISFFCVESVNATFWNLQDGSSLISVQADAIQGAFGWVVDSPPLSNGGGGNFWYREGVSGGESFLGSVAPVSGIQTSSNLLSLVYDVGNFTLSVDYEIQGGSVGLNEGTFLASVTVSNVSSSSDFHLFHNWKYRLGADSEDESLEILNNNEVQTQDGNIFGISRYTTADHFIATTNNLIFELGDGNPTTFSDIAGPVGSGILSSGFQWDITLGVGETQTFTVEHHVFVVPEPSTIILMMIAGLGCWMRRRWISITVL